MSVELEVTVLSLTEKALRVRVEETADVHWVPLSVVDLDSTNVELERGATGTLAVTEWFAEKEGLE